MEKMNGKVCIVTGSNTGIGKETVRGLSQRGATVVMACRDVEKGERARNEIVGSTGRGDIRVLPLDLADQASIPAFAESFRKLYDRLDVLVNNAGVNPMKRRTTQDGFESTFGVNHLGTMRVTLELLDVLKQSAPSRVVVVSSKLHSRGTMNWDDLQFERRKFSAWSAYNDSKLANVLFTKALARRLRGSGVTVNALHPGVVATDLARDLPSLLVRFAGLFMLTPEKGARCSLHVACAPEIASVTGEYFDNCKVVPASRLACDEAAQERLWEASVKLLGLPSAIAA